MSEKLKKLLWEAVASEMQASIQYMWQHVTFPKAIEGVKSSVVTKIKKKLKRIAIEEMRHAEDIAEELFEMGGALPLEPSKVVLDEKPEDMLKRNSEDEQRAIDMYTEIINLAKQEGNFEIADLFERIRNDEMRHKSIFLKFIDLIFRI